MPPKTLTIAALASVVGAASMLPASAAFTISTTAADARVRFDGNLATTATAIEVGSHGASYATNQFRSVYIMPFQLPTLAVGEAFANVGLSFTVAGIDNMPASQHADLYGMTRVDASGAAIAGDFFEGALDGANTLLQDMILTNASSPGANGTNASGGAALTTFLNTQYAGGANAGNFVFLRLSSNEQPSGGNQRFRITTFEDAANNSVATLTYDVVPEPSSALLGLLGTGFFFLRRRR